MSLMGYENVRRYPPDPLSFTGYYYHDRNDSLNLTHSTRLDMRGYSLGGPVVNPHTRPGYGQDEPLTEHGHSRRRIAVACARCRKRKIRCSGDPGDGSGCSNCRGAGLDASQCLFHRVGSDNVQKVMEGIATAHSLTGMANHSAPTSVYNMATNGPMYGRTMTTQGQELDSRPAYSSTWVNHYAEDSSADDTYNLEPQGTYSPAVTSGSGTYTYAPPSQWMTHRAMKLGLHNVDSNFDRNTMSIPGSPPYASSNNHTATVNNEIQPLLSMSSLQMSLPERPQRQILPIPQPNSARSSRNVVDQLQHQRLRTEQGSGTLSNSVCVAYNKSPSSWASDHSTMMNVPCTTGAGTQMQTTCSTDIIFPFMASTLSTTGAITTGNTAPQTQLNFSAPPLLDAINAHTPATTYSNFRQSHIDVPQNSKQRSHDPHTNLYSLATDKSDNRSLQAEQDSSEKILANRHHYTSSAQNSPSNLTGHETLQREPMLGRKNPLDRSSRGNLSSML